MGHPKRCSISDRKVTEICFFPEPISVTFLSLVYHFCGGFWYTCTKFWASEPRLASLACLAGGSLAWPACWLGWLAWAACSSWLGLAGLAGLAGWLAWPPGCLAAWPPGHPAAWPPDRLLLRRLVASSRRRVAAWPPALPAFSTEPIKKSCPL